jgi:cysteine desulfurase
MATSIYLDNNATTAVDPEVLEEMIPYFSEHYGNAASLNHRFGKKAAEAVIIARSRIADLIDASEKEITFTSGATEAINLAIKGVFNRYQSIGKHIITSQTEHKAVLDVCQYLEKKGAEITYLAVDSEGKIDLNELQEAIRKDTILISLMYANNETGIINPINEIAELANTNKVLFFCDATQAVGKIPISTLETPIDLMAFSAHKMYGPKGVGALYMKRKNRRIQLEPLLHGGGQENHLRAGTLNVPGIVGFGSAALKAEKLMEADSLRLKELRDYLEEEILKIEQTNSNGSKTNRLAHVSNITIRFLKAEQLMAQLGNIAMASGSACSTGSLEPSHVLLAMGLEKEDAHASLRLSLGRFTTKEEIEITIHLLKKEIALLRKQSPIWQLYEKGMIK